VAACATGKGEDTVFSDLALTGEGRMDRSGHTVDRRRSVRSNTRLGSDGAAITLDGRSQGRLRSVSTTGGSSHRGGVQAANGWKPVHRGTDHHSGG